MSLRVESTWTASQSRKYKWENHDLLWIPRNLHDSETFQRKMEKETEIIKVKYTPHHLGGFNSDMSSSVIFIYD